MTGELEGRVAVVTGAASGIGAAVAAKLALAGARLICTDINSDGAVEVAAKLTAGGAVAHGISLDVADPVSWQGVAEHATVRFGRADILANCAGIASFSPAETISPEEWRRVHAVNLDGPMFGIQALLPLLKQSDAGAVVNIASTSARIGATYGVAYSTSKAGLVALTKSTAKFFNFQGYDCRCNVILPGHVETPLLDKVLSKRTDPAAAKEQAVRMLYQRRTSTADEIADSVLFLSSRRSGNMTGAELVIDGGLLA